MVARDPDGAIYHQIAAAIRERIDNGTYPPGQPIPTEAALMHEWRVGKGTIRRVMKELRVAGLVFGLPGQVARVRSDWPMVELAVQRGSVVRFRPASAVEKEDLEVGDGMAIAEIEFADRVEVYALDRTVLVYV